MKFLLLNLGQLSECFRPPRDSNPASSLLPTDMWDPPDPACQMLPYLDRAGQVSPSFAWRRLLLPQLGGISTFLTPQKIHEIFYSRDLLFTVFDIQNLRPFDLVPRFVLQFRFALWAGVRGVFPYFEQWNAACSLIVVGFLQRHLGGGGDELGDFLAAGCVSSTNSVPPVSYLNLCLACFVPFEVLGDFSFIFSSFIFFSQCLGDFYVFFGTWDDLLLDPHMIFAL